MARLFLDNIAVRDVKNLYRDNEIIKRLSVKFTDKGGKIAYWWVPVWKDVTQLFQCAYDVEINNEGGSEWLLINAAFNVIRRELERCGLQSNYVATVEEIARKIEAASSWNLEKPVKWDYADLE